ncbi:MAG: FecR domain-containing protein [Betaproteobacteria bacterium]
MTQYKAYIDFFASACFAALMLLASVAHAGSPGTVISTSGPASLLAADGSVRMAKPGAPVNAGDTAVTGEQGQLHIRFSDDSMVQLHAKTQFRIDQYAFSGKADDDSKGFFSLLKGGFRTVTGLLGKYNRSTYRVNTPAATIGIRGTEYIARLDNGLHVQVEHGEISLANRAGSFSVSEGQRAYVANSKSVPKYVKLGNAAQGGSGRSNASASGTQIQGNTQINANAVNVNAIAVGQENTAGNKIGAIGGK